MEPPALPVRRRRLLCALGAAAVPGVPAATTATPPAPRSRPRPGDARWPDDAQWRALGARVGGRLRRLASPWDGCAARAPCARLFASPQNPYRIADDPALTQTFGWVDAWSSHPSAYAVLAASSADVAAAVDFARAHDLRLVVKGGGHSYQGTSCAPDSLLVWTRPMEAAQVQEAFVPRGLEGVQAPVRALRIGAGALWSRAYDAATTRGGGYVQGGGCLTVGVAGLVQSGGFGSFSKAFGTASGSLLEAEVVTADGAVRIANAATHPDLFWAIKGGGGGSFGVVTALALRVHPLPERFGAVDLTVRAGSDAAFRRLIGTVLRFAAERLVNPHWGEQLRFRRDRSVQVSMVFQGLTRGEAEAVWQPFFDAVGADRELAVDFSLLKIVSTSARDFFAPTWVKSTLGFIAGDDRAGAPKENVFWPGDRHQAGQVIHGYDSLWLPAALLRADRRDALADALQAASRHWRVSLHLNKGLAGAPREAIAAAADSALHPDALGAFALAIVAADQPTSHADVEGHRPDVATARERAGSVARAAAELRRVAPSAGSYVSESDYFRRDWQRAFWGGHHARLAAIKERVDPGGLFFVRHGVGSDGWSDDGFRRLA